MSTDTATTGVVEDDTTEGSAGSEEMGGSNSSTTQGDALDSTTTTSAGSEEGSTEDTGLGPGPDCGDGVVDEREACDDGGESSSCNADCTVAVCGDGVFNAAAGEQCDDGGESAGCDVDCTPAVCGDGVFNAAAGEQCDQGPGNAACDADCTLAGCGDGVVNAMAGEQCDDGGESASCNSDCSSATCGDGVTNVTAGEACDDAGPSVGCDADCTPVVCGDAVINAVAGEQCDGLELGGATCQSEDFFSGVLACDGGCSVDTTGCSLLPAAPVLELSVSQVKRLDFSWAALPGVDYYQLRESPAPGEPFGAIGPDTLDTERSLTVPLHLRFGASYVLRACNDEGCSDSAPVEVTEALVDAIGYFKASNAEAEDYFGHSVALSDDGNTLAVGAYGEDSSSTGIDGGQGNSISDSGAGAVYVFVRDASGQWSQQAYVKALHTSTADLFGYSVALSSDGDTLAVGASGDSSAATGIDGEPFEFGSSEFMSGAVHVFTRDEMDQWSQQAYIKASNTGAHDWFGFSVALSDDGDTLAVGAQGESSAGTGIVTSPGGIQLDDSAPDAGAAYVFTRDEMEQWSQQAYIKASNTDAEDDFGARVALSGDGDTLAVTADEEDSAATGIDGDGLDNTADRAGAVYVYARDGMGQWSQQAYVKASNTEPGDAFGIAVALSGDGDTLAVTAVGEDGGISGVDGDQADDSEPVAGAVYVYTHDEMGAWSQQAYIKASTPESQDQLGWCVALSADGRVLAAGAQYEDSGATGINGDQVDNAVAGSGAGYVLVRDDAGEWSQAAYLKAPNPDPLDSFGLSCALSGDGETLAIGTRNEQSGATGIGGDQGDNSQDDAGAVYLY